MDCDIRWEGIVQQLTGQEAEAGPSDDDLDDDDVFAVGAMEDQVENLHLDRSGEPPGAAARDSLSAVADSQLGAAPPLRPVAGGVPRIPSFPGCTFRILRCS